MAFELLRILLVEDNAADARLLVELLKDAPAVSATVEHAESLGEAKRRLAEGTFEVVLLDLALGDARGLDTVAEVQRLVPSVPIVVLTGLDDDRTALEAMAAGAEDYLVKGKIDAGLLARAMRYAIQRKRAEDNVRSLVREQVARAQAERSERRARFLADAARRLADSLAYDATLALAADLAVPALGDFCVVDAYEEGGVRRAVARGGPTYEALASEALAFTPDPTSPNDVIGHVLRTREPVLLADLEAHLQGSPAADPHLAYLRRLAPRSVIVVPLVARGRTLGAMTIVSAQPMRRYTAEDLDFAVDLSGRVALAVDNAKLYRAREDMLAVVSHDLRNPLNVIGFAVATLHRSGVPDEQRRNYLDKIRRASDRMNRLIEDLLDVSRLEGDSLPMELAAQPAAPLLHELVDQMRPLADEKSLRLVSEVMGALPNVMVDRERMQQVLSNLVGNALKFTPAGGTITVGASAEGGTVKLRVSDTGPGIAPEHLARIFDRFWQARRRDRQGAGLGLAIARGIVLAHGGRIWVESRLGQGTTFYVTLPPVPAQSAITQLAPPSREGRVAAHR